MLMAEGGDEPEPPKTTAPSSLRRNVLRHGTAAAPATATAPGTEAPELSGTSESTSEKELRGLGFTNVIAGRLSAMVGEGGILNGLGRLREAGKRTDHPLSRSGWAQVCTSISP